MRERIDLSIDQRGQEIDLTSAVDGPIGQYGVLAPVGGYYNGGVNATVPTPPPASSNVWSTATAVATAIGNIFDKTPDNGQMGTYNPYMSTYPQPTSMSTGAVVGIAVGALALIGTLIYFGTKK